MTDNSKTSRSIVVGSAVLALVFFGAGAAKLAGAQQVVEDFVRFGFGSGFMRFIGACEIAGAVGLLVPHLAPLAAAGLFVIMTGAVAQHVLHDPLVQALVPAMLLVLCAVVGYSRRAELAR